MGEAQSAQTDGLSAPQRQILTRQQRSGNSAVLNSLRFQRETEAQTKIQKLDELLDKWNVPESEVIALLGQMDAVEKNTVITDGYKGKPDEYPDSEAPPTRVLTNDNSLMANFWQQGIAAAEIKARLSGAYRNG